MAFQTTEGLLKDATETDLNAAGGSVHFIWRPFLEEHGSVECCHSKSVAEKDNYLEWLSFLQGLIGDRYLDGEGPYSSTQGASLAVLYIGALTIYDAEVSPVGEAVAIKYMADALERLAAG